MKRYFLNQARFTVFKRISVLMLMMVLAAAALSANGNGESEGAEVPVREGYSSADIEAINFQWKVEGENLSVQLTAPTTGWVAIGFDPSRKMKDANIIIGYLDDDGKARVRDDFGTGQTRHGADTDNGGSEDLSDIEGEEADGMTRIRFTIPLDSGDSMDKPLSPGNTYTIIAAYGPDGKDDFGSYHATRGSADIEL